MLMGSNTLWRSLISQLPIFMAN